MEDYQDEFWETIKSIEGLGEFACGGLIDGPQPELVVQVPHLRKGADTRAFRAKSFARSVRRHRRAREVSGAKDSLHCLRLHRCPGCTS